MIKLIGIQMPHTHAPPLMAATAPTNWPATEIAASRSDATARFLLVLQACSHLSHTPTVLTPSQVLTEPTTAGLAAFLNPLCIAYDSNFIRHYRGR